MDRVDTKNESESDVVDPSTPFVTVAIAKELADSTTPHDQSINEAPTQYHLYKRRWLGIVALVRAHLLREIRSLDAQSPDRSF